jgi:hypothetical protein
MSIPDWLLPLEHEYVTWRAPASEDAIASVARRFAVQLPEALVELWQTSDGFGLGPFEGEVLGAGQVLALLDAHPSWAEETLLEPGRLPVLSDGHSNYISLHVKPPLAPRLSSVPHDAAPELVYRDLRSLIAHLPSAFESGETADYYFQGAPEGDYAPALPRTPADQQAAEVLLQGGGEEQLIQAIALLDTKQTDIWARLLESDHFVRREAMARLSSLTEPNIVELLKRDAAAFADFVEFAKRAVQNAGLSVEREKDLTLRVNGRWYNLDGLFYRRTIPDAFAKLSAWFADRNAGKPRAPGDYL